MENKLLLVGLSFVLICILTVEFLFCKISLLPFWVLGVQVIASILIPLIFAKRLNLIQVELEREG